MFQSRDSGTGPCLTDASDQYPRTSSTGTEPRVKEVIGIRTRIEFETEFESECKVPMMAWYPTWKLGYSMVLNGFVWFDHPSLYFVCNCSSGA
jgi:hypothetical protein